MVRSFLSGYLVKSLISRPSAGAPGPPRTTVYRAAPRPQRRPYPPTPTRPHNPLSPTGALPDRARRKTGCIDGSLKGLMQGYWKSDSLSFITRKGERKGWSNVLKMYQKAYNNRQKMGTLSFEILKRRYLNPQNSLANVVGMYRVDKELKGEQHRDSGYFSLIFRKQDNRDWKIIIDHTY